MIFRRLVPLLCSLVAVALSHAQSTSPAVLQTPPTFVVSPGGGSVSFDLRSYFGLPGVTGTAVQWETTLGKFNMELFPTTNPRTVANFLSYVNAGLYNETIFDVSAPGVYIGGGTFKHELSTTPIAQGSPIANEVYWSNVRGTIAMAHNDLNNPNSATSAWFFNVSDNSGAPFYLDTAGGGNSVFGRVLGLGMKVIDDLSRVPTYKTGNFNYIPLQNVGDTQTYIELVNYLAVISIRSLPLYPTVSNPDAVLALTVVSNSNGAVATATISGSSLVVTPVAASGTTYVRIRVAMPADSGLNYAEGTVPVSVIAQTAPVIVEQPAALSMPAGSTAVFTVGVSGYPQPSYQWRKNGVDIAGANSSALLLRNISATDAAAYSVAVINLQGAVTSAAASLTVTSASADPGRIVNLSARTNSGSGTQVLNVGFVVAGEGASGTIPVLVRGIGPGLVPMGVPANVVLTDPTISLIRQSNGAATIGANDDWGGTTALVNAAAAVGASPLSNPNSKDSALLATLDGNVYSVVASGVGSTTGQVLAEIYDATSAYTATTPRLVNVSARAQVGTGGDILTAGFVIVGSTPRTVLIRGVGPTLASQGVTTGFLADPQLYLYRAHDGISTLVASNDNWGGGSAFMTAAAQTGAFTLTSANEAVLLLTLPPGVYSAQVSGVNATTGIALVEVYEVY
jgi:cyclophilin family peptidyl-prolyl cis-trans isomerase